MKHLLGNNIWIVFVSLILVVLFLSLHLTPKNIYPPIDEMPFIITLQNQEQRHVQKDLWHVREGNIRLAPEALFSLESTYPENTIWNGASDFIFVHSGTSDNPVLHIQDETLQISSKHPSTTLSIQRVLRPGLNIEIVLSDFGNHTQAVAQYSGLKNDKITLRPDLESYQNAVLIRPIDAFEIETTTYMYFQFAWIENGSNLCYGLIEGSWNEEKLIWNIVQDHLGFSEQGKGSTALVCQNQAWFIQQNGTVVSVNLANGHITTHVNLSYGQTPSSIVDSDLFRYKNALVIQYKNPDKSCLIYLLENNKIRCNIRSDGTFVSTFRNQKECMSYRITSEEQNPYNWSFPID